MRFLKVLLFGTVAWMAASSTALGTPLADVQLTIQDGRVSLIATNVTVRQILTEWARIGQTKIVNVERISGGPVTLQLTNVPELQALDVLLRSVSGYLAAPRPTDASNLSRFDRIILLPTSVAPRAPAASPSPVFQQPQLLRPSQPPSDDDSDDERPVPSVPVPDINRGAPFSTFPPPQPVNPLQQPVPNVPVPNNNRGPLFSTFPPPQPVNPQQQGQPTRVPGLGAAPQQPAAAPSTRPSGVGVAVPGMIVPAPQQPGQQPGAPAPQRTNSPEGQ